ncbi:MAG: beta-propeller domain-containing protein [Clostridiaceae bacterium]
MKKDYNENIEKSGTKEDDLKNYFKKTEIPEELSAAVNKGMEKGKHEKKKRKWNRTLKIACSFALVMTLGIISYNISLKNTGNNNQTLTDDGNLILPHIKNQEELQSLIGSNYGQEKSISQNIADGSGISDGTKNKEEYSTTNIQVASVDEGDVVKTDGTYIYTIKNNIYNYPLKTAPEVYGEGSGKVIVIKATDPADMKVISQIDIKGTIDELYITKDKVVILATNYLSSSKTELYIYNKEDISSLKLERKLSFSGLKVTSRLIEDKLLMVINNTPYSIRAFDTNQGSSSGEQKSTGYLPKYYDSLTDKEITIPVQDIEYCPGTNMESILTIAAIDVQNYKKAIKMENILASAGNIYSTQNNLYIAGSGIGTNRAKTLIIDDTLNTSIYKFSLKNGDIKLTAKGSVKGRTLNQFSMDEKGDSFRIATTNGWADNSTNNLYILDKDLKVTGKLEGLASTERIYSVRFMENTVFMVTFRQVDPLFVIDIKDEKNPVVKGQVKIPGFSSYLHPVDNETLVGFGQEMNSEGNVRIGMKLSLFDVKDETSPKEISALIIGNADYYSEVLYDHKGFFINKDKLMVGIPVREYNRNDGKTYNLVYLAKYSKEDGLKKFGELLINEDSDQSKMRIIYIGEYLYVITSECIFSYDINTLFYSGRINY